MGKCQVATNIPVMKTGFFVKIIRFKSVKESEVDQGNPFSHTKQPKNMN